MLGSRHFPEARAIRHHKPLQLPSPASFTGFDDVASRGFARAGPPGEVAAVNLRSSRVVTLAFEQHFRLWLCGPWLLGISILVPSRMACLMKELSNTLKTSKDRIEGVLTVLAVLPKQPD